MPFCASCGGQVLDVAAFCPFCGKAIRAAEPAIGTVAPATGTAAAIAPNPAPAPNSAGWSGLENHVAGMLAYITVVPAIMFLFMKPYNGRPFVRFHAFQCLFLTAAWLALGIILMSLGMIPFFAIVVLPLFAIAIILGMIVAIVCLLKAYQGQMWKLPVIGAMAEKQANNM
jgi:uncharacterized membrane protein